MLILFKLASVPTCDQNLLITIGSGRFSSLNYVPGYEPWKGYIGSSDYWMADTPGIPAMPDKAFVWYHLDLGMLAKVTQVLTQGSGGNGWIKNYFLRFTQDTTLKRWFGHYDKDGFLKLLPGNVDEDSIVSHQIGPYRARFVRFYPQEYQTNMAGRFGVRGCPGKSKSVFFMFMLFMKVP